MVLLIRLLLLLSFLLLLLLLLLIILLLLLCVHLSIDITFICTYPRLCLVAGISHWRKCLNDCNSYPLVLFCSGERAESTEEVNKVPHKLFSNRDNISEVYRFLDYDVELVWNRTLCWKTDMFLVSKFWLPGRDTALDKFTVLFSRVIEGHVFFSRRGYLEQKTGNRSSSQQARFHQLAFENGIV